MCLCCCRENEELIAKLAIPPAGSKDLYFKSAYPQGQGRQLALLLKKDLITYWRSPNYNTVRFVFTIILALIVGAIYWDLGSRRWGTSVTILRAHDDVISVLMACITESQLLLSGQQNGLCLNQRGQCQDAGAGRGSGAFEGWCCKLRRVRAGAPRAMC